MLAVEGGAAPNTGLCSVPLVDVFLGWPNRELLPPPSVAFPNKPPDDAPVVVDVAPNRLLDDAGVVVLPPDPNPVKSPNLNGF